MFESIKVIAFDADDTLWVNETYFRETEGLFGKLLSTYETPNQIQQALFKKEIENLEIYGYGIKGFVLSMIECAIEVSQGKLEAKQVEEIIEMGKVMLQKPVELIDGVESLLSKLKGRYRLLVITKGDLLDQERKLEKSGLYDYFDHVQVLSDKKPKDYEHLLRGLDIDPNEFLMIGNSLKSDVLPLLEIGAQAIHVPFHTTWEHEEATARPEDCYITLNKIDDLIPLLH